MLRNATEFEYITLYSYYYNKLSDYETQMRVIVILASLFLLLSLGILIPYVFKVHKTNNRVLSLFGMINIAEIKELANRCESYSITFIEDKKFIGESMGNLDKGVTRDSNNQLSVATC